MLLLGLDLGTTNVKAVVVRPRGQVVAASSCPISLFHVGPAGLEQDLEEIWTATLNAIRLALSQTNAGEVDAVGVSSQGGALQLLTPDGRPHGRVISWLDQRGAADDQRFTARQGRSWLRSHIGRGHSGFAIGQLLRLHRESPAALTPPNRIGFVGDCIVDRLCGSPAQDATSAGLTLLLNPSSRTYDRELLAQLEVEAEQLPNLIPPQQPAGRLRPEAAAATGLRPDIPVTAAIHDQYAAALSTAAIAPGDVMVGAGTAWVLLAVSGDLPEPVTDDAFTCPHLVDGAFGQILSMVNGGSALRWALSLMGRSQASPQDIESLIAAAPPGADGLCFWPFMTPFGATGLAPGTRGRLSGIQLGHTPAHVARAVVEGLTFELGRHLDFLRHAGTPLRRLVMGGTVAASATTTQVVADVTGLPLTCQPEGHGSPLGAAILARSLLEPRAPLASLVHEMVPPGRTVVPSALSSFYLDQWRNYLDGLPAIATTQPGSDPEPDPTR